MDKPWNSGYRPWEVWPPLPLEKRTYDWLTTIWCTDTTGSGVTVRIPSNDCICSPTMSDIPNQHGTGFTTCSSSFLFTNLFKTFQKQDEHEHQKSNYGWTNCLKQSKLRKHPSLSNPWFSMIFPVNVGHFLQTVPWAQRHRISPPGTWEWRKTPSSFEGTSDQVHG